MLTRRYLIVSFAALLGLATGSLPRVAQAQSAAAASEFVDQTGKALVGVVNGSGSPVQKQPQLTSIIEQRVAVDAIAQFCLGRFWRTATPSQQQEYVTLFHHVLVNNITGKMGQFRGVTFTMGRALPRGGDVAVGTTVTRPGNAPNQVQWIVGNVAGSPKIIDVVAEGTSLRLTQRQDYASFLARNGNSIPTFLQALHRQADAVPG